MRKLCSIRSLTRAALVLLAVLLPVSLASGALVLPTPQQQATFNPLITESIQPNPPISYGLVTLANVPAGYTVTNGNYIGWCMDPLLGLTPGVIYYPIMYSTYDLAGLASIGVPTAGNIWNKINYIINHKPVGANCSTIQAAIWRYINFSQADEDALIAGTYGFGFPPADLATINAIVADADLNGAAFVPAPGQLIGVYLNLPIPPNATIRQPFMIEVLCPPTQTPTGRLGDFVWKDTNMNGIQDAGEPGINGVPVTLKDGNGTVLKTTTTGPNPNVAGQNGYYQFTELAAGTYIVSVDNSAPALAGCVPTTTGAPGSTTSNDSNSNPFTVILPTDSSSDQTIDFGYKQIPPPTGRLGDFVWKDTNMNGIQDAGEPGINGVTVTLKNGSGTLLATTTTIPNPNVVGQNGYYQFTGLAAGTYIVTVDNNSPALAGCVPTSTNAPGSTTSNDSNPNPFTVVLPTDSSSDQTIDFGYKAVPPGFSLTKTVNKTTIKAGEPVTYTYTVTNTGAVTLTNVTVTDDNATPNYAGDDFVVVTGLTLAPGQSQAYTVTTFPPIKMCTVINTVQVDAGILIIEKLANNDIKVTYRQSLNLVDNTYGTGTSPDWNRNHSFNDFLGSDKAQFVFSNGAGAKVLDVDIDYISASSSFPSGYGTLGASGGDGQVNFGSASSLASFTTTMTTNLNQSPAFYGYTTNSPPINPPLPGWDYVDGYTVVVKAATFGTSGFGSVSVPAVHNSPPKIGSNKVLPVPCKSEAKNTARGTAKAGTTTLTAQAMASVFITPPPPPPGPFKTYKQDSKGWDGTTAGNLLNANFATLYPNGVTIGGTKTLKFTSKSAVQAYLPRSGTPGALTSSATNPTSSSGGELPGQVLALRLNVDFSNAGITRTGLAALKMKSGKFIGQTVQQVLNTANAVLGGGALPSGISYADVNAACKTINENYDQGTTDKGNLIP